jgi:hypothetical protein
MFKDEKIVLLQAIYMTHENEEKGLIPIYKGLLEQIKTEDNKEDNFAINYKKHGKVNILCIIAIVIINRKEGMLWKTLN